MSSINLNSDLTLNAQKFSPASIPLKTQLDLKALKFDADTLDKLSTGLLAGLLPKNWYEVDWKTDSTALPQIRDKYTKNNAIHFPSSQPLPSIGKFINIRSKDSDRTIPCRLIWASSKTKPEDCNGVFLHIHGGGFVLGDEKSQDKLLKMYANAGNLLVISVGYRLAPEYAFPEGPDDCFDIARWLVDTKPYGESNPLRFIGGESGGAHLSMLTTLRLLRIYPSLHLSGIIQTFGSYTLTKLPSTLQWKKNLILSPSEIDAIITAILPNTTFEQKQDPGISPFFENLEEFRGRLPSALFICGTEDPLLDDTTCMGMKWMEAGAEAVVKIYPGAPHGFILFNEGIKKIPFVSEGPFEAAVEALKVMELFIYQRMKAVI